MVVDGEEENNWCRRGDTLAFKMRRNISCWDGQAWASYLEIGGAEYLESELQLFLGYATIGEVSDVVLIQKFGAQGWKSRCNLYIR